MLLCTTHTKSRCQGETATVTFWWFIIPLCSVTDTEVLNCKYLPYFNQNVSSLSLTSLLPNISFLSKKNRGIMCGISKWDNSIPHFRIHSLYGCHSVTLLVDMCSGQVESFLIYSLGDRGLSSSTTRSWQPRNVDEEPASRQSSASTEQQWSAALSCAVQK